MADIFALAAAKNAGCSRWRCRMCGPKGDERVAARRAGRHRLARDLRTLEADRPGCADCGAAGCSDGIRFVHGRWLCGMCEVGGDDTGYCEACGGPCDGLGPFLSTPGYPEDWHVDGMHPDPPTWLVLLEVA